MYAAEKRVERAGILAGAEWMADLDWYGVGAAILPPGVPDPNACFDPTEVGEAVHGICVVGDVDFDTGEISRYVTWNWKDNHWITGKIVRLSGVPAGILPNPILIYADGFMWNHGVGYQYPGAAAPFAAPPETRVLDEA